MPEFFLELFSEEIPARLQADAADRLAAAFKAEFSKLGIACTQVSNFVTPRRLGVVIRDLPAQQESRSEEFRGPRIDAPEVALQGFLKSKNITLDACTQKDTGKGVYWVYNEHIEGGKLDAVLPDVITSVIAGFSWPKSMRWGTHKLRWVRPLLSVVAIFDGQVVPVRMPHMDDSFTAGRVTYGHRFLAPQEIEVSDFDDYKDKLRDAFVVIDREERKKKIKTLAQDMAASQNLSLREDGALFDELSGLVEWPSVVTGSFDEEFLSVPQEALIASMRGHQKYLSLIGDTGLSNKFIIVTNMPPEGERTQNIIEGNQKVLKARLSDARFFWDQDLKTPLEKRNDRLSSVVFHAKLGTLQQKVSRLETLAAKIAQEIDADIPAVQRAARLCKSDLVTSMVSEFPELQGIMGMHYARHQGETQEVAQAIADHYKPAGPADAIPEAPVSIALALADKIDTITGFFAIDEKPTGSRDPYALRRAALGIIRIVIQHDLHVPLKDIFRSALEAYLAQSIATVATAVEKAGGDVARSLEQWGVFEFILERMKHSLKDGGMDLGVIDAVLSSETNSKAFDLLAVRNRVACVQEFLVTDKGQTLLASYKRAANIVRIEKFTVDAGANVDAAALKTQEENDLLDALKKVEASTDRMLEKHAYAEALLALTELQNPIDVFFEKVKVNDNDPVVRKNRLGLLARTQGLIGQIADLSRVK